MPGTGPIVIVEDDIDDQHILEEVMSELAIPNERIFFTRSDDAINYLKTTTAQPFLIVCDINLPGLNGLQFKQQLDADDQLKKKSIPFIFFTTAADLPTVTK